MAGTDARRRGGTVAETTNGRSPWPPMGDTLDIELMPGGESDVTWAELERRCLPALTAAIRAVTRWRWTDPGAGWKIGDYAALILESTVADEASLYTQIWAEPLEPVCWEVSSGHSNPGARPFVEGLPASRLEARGFSIGGRADNFQKEVSVQDRAGAVAMARDMLRIFHDAFGYRGATPLAISAFRQQRATTDAVVHSSLTIEDAQKLLRGLGIDAATAESAPRLLFCRRGKLAFVARLDAQVEEQSLFQCLDLVSWVGEAAEFDDLGWINHLNHVSRVARAAVDNEGTVLMTTGIILFGGVTEVYLAERIKSWFEAVVEVLSGKLPGSRKRKRPRRAPGASADGDSRGRGAATVH
jgi:hypothetical protein